MKRSLYIYGGALALYAALLAVTWWIGTANGCVRYFDEARLEKLVPNELSFHFSAGFDPATMPAPDPSADDPELAQASVTIATTLFGQEAFCSRCLRRCGGPVLRPAACGREMKQA